MSEDFTPKLGLPYLLPDQAQKHVTLNESLSRLDSLVVGTLKARGQNTPPDMRLEGDAWLIGDAPTGDWAVWPGDIAVWRDGAWLRLVPQTGWRFWVEDEAILIFFDGDNWSTLSLDAQDLEFIGLGARADANNPLLARLNAALFTARERDQNGSGDVRLTLNKETATNICALNMQTGFSGRLEFGLLGNDELRVKVSDNGQDWRDALICVPDTGRLGVGTYPDGDTQMTVAGRVRIKSPTSTFTLHEDGRLELSQTDGSVVSIQAVSAGSTLELGAVAEDGSWRGGMLAIDPNAPELICAHRLRPSGAHVQELGAPEQAWRTLYLDTAPILDLDPARQISTSALPGTLDLIQALTPIVYQKPDASTLHFGFSVDNVEAALDAIGVSDAALYRSSPTPGLRPTELIPVLVGALQAVETRLARIEQIARSAGLL